jgi:hypothetical protein
MREEISERVPRRPTLQPDNRSRTEARHFTTDFRCREMVEHTPCTVCTNCAGHNIGIGVEWVSCGSSRARASAPRLSMRSRTTGVAASSVEFGQHQRRLSQTNEVCHLGRLSLLQPTQQKGEQHQRSLSETSHHDSSSRSNTWHGHSFCSRNNSRRCRSSSSYSSGNNSSNSRRRDSNSGVLKATPVPLR